MLPKVFAREYDCVCLLGLVDIIASPFRMILYQGSTSFAEMPSRSRSRSRTPPRRSRSRSRSRSVSQKRRRAVFHSRFLNRDAENIPGRLCPPAAGTLAIAKTPTLASVSASLDSASTPRRENLRPSSASLDRWRR